MPLLISEQLMIYVAVVFSWSITPNYTLIRIMYGDRNVWLDVSCITEYIISVVPKNVGSNVSINYSKK